MGETVTRYHVSLDVADKAGVLASVAQAFAAHDVSIQTVRQEGHGDDATLVLVTHEASDAALAATVEDLRALDAVRAVASVMRVEGGRGMTATTRTHRRRGAASSRSSATDSRSPSATPVVTLLEGGTPLVPAPRLSELTGCEVHLKVEGLNPTGSFKDRGMTMAISKAAEEGSKAVICASTGNTSASAAAYAVRAGHALRRPRAAAARSRWASWRRRWSTAPGCCRSTATSTTA